MKQELSSVRITPSANPVNGSQSYTASRNSKKSLLAKVEAGLDAVNAAAKNMQSDAPACNTCGHITLVVALVINALIAVTVWVVVKFTPTPKRAIK